MGCNSSTEATQSTSLPPNNSIPIDITSQPIRQPLQPSSQEFHQKGKIQESRSENQIIESLEDPNQTTVAIANESEVELPHPPEMQAAYQPTEPTPDPEPAVVIIQSLPYEMESSDDGSELSRDSFEGSVITNKPSPVILQSSITATTQPKAPQSKAPQLAEVMEDKVSAPEKPIVAITSKEEFIYEYERWQPFVQWGQSSPGHMLPSDPGMYVDPISPSPRHLS